ncbi:MAG: DNA polymerase III subunit beta [Candidatus Tokpelaia sp. JSC161]|jgi:DNA polymerase-3 subunit beta|nr:MAG: DNA polymerase III subunit beta [Candidatus Tokpelaia sp. JSC161]
MHIIVDRTKFLKSLGRVHRVVERRNTIPILSNVLIEAFGSRLHLKTTDLDLEVREKTTAEVKEGGGITVPAHLLYDIIRKLPDASEVTLILSSDRGAIFVIFGRSKFRLQCLPKEDFPELNVSQFTHSFELSSKVLKRLIHCTHFAVSSEDTRYYLNGIYLHILDHDGVLKFRAVATDGHRLARVEMTAPSGLESMPGVIVPRKTVSELQKLLNEEQTDSVFVELSETKIRFRIASLILTSKLIEGTFPDYQRVIPLDNDKKLLVNRAMFSLSVDRVSTISSDRGRAVKLSLSMNQLTLLVNNPDSGTAEDCLSVEYASDGMDIGFNSRYLLDIVTRLLGKNLIFMLGDSGSPTLIFDPQEVDVLYVLMPMRF